MRIQRRIKEDIVSSLQPGRATVILGARRVGKTTLIKEITARIDDGLAFFNCDDPDVRREFDGIGLSSLKRLVRESQIIVFDEAQRIKNIGLILKMIVDELPEKRLLVSGSSSLELSDEIAEPLTGRKKTFHLYPISVGELFAHEKRRRIATASFVNDLLVYGGYPHVFDIVSGREKASYLLELAGDYLYRDALEYQEVRNPEQLRNLLTAIALQIGQEVSYSELGNLVGIDQKTVLRYLDLLEKSFVIFRLPAFSRNLRTEIAKSRKIYFYDLGIRNALLKNFNSYDLRSDKGAAFENLVISERMKRDAYTGTRKNYYFWRTYWQKEVDLIEEYQGGVHGIEIKWAKDKRVSGREFLHAYPGSTMETVTRETFLDFVI